MGWQSGHAPDCKSGTGGFDSHPHFQRRTMSKIKMTRAKKKRVSKVLAALMGEVFYVGSRVKTRRSTRWSVPSGEIGTVVEKKSSFLDDKEVICVKLDSDIGYEREQPWFVYMGDLTHVE